MSRARRRKALIQLVLAAVVFIVAALVYSNTALLCSRYTKRVGKLPETFEGATIVMLSDLHNKRFGRKNSLLLTMVELEKPDIIVLAGDMVSSGSEDFTVFYELAEQLCRLAPVYYAPGNHEGRFEPEVRDALFERAAQLGVNVLDNSCLQSELGGVTVNIYGLTMEGHHYGPIRGGTTEYPLTVEQMRTRLGEPDPDEFNMLIAHTPLYFEQYAAWGADLVFSGHVHGGVVRLPFVGGVLSPHVELFPEYDAGRFDIGESTMLLSRGLGEHSLPVRLFNPGDICVIRLESLQSSKPV